MLSLLANGTPPQAIRIVDVKRPFRTEFLRKPASLVDIIQADIGTESDALSAFRAPWSEEAGIAKLPLTVFHTAATIRFQERSNLFWDRCARVNVTGTSNVLEAARSSGAEIFIFTSSCCVGHKEVGWFPPPWRRYPRNFIQQLDGSDFKEPLMLDSQFCSNYARSKAVAERLVCSADEGGGGGMRTGAIRPGNAIYGHQNDGNLGRQLAMTWAPSFTGPAVQNWVHVGNAALAHLRLEAVLLSPHANKVASRPFLVSDNGPPITFEDAFTIMGTASSTGFTVVRPPPVLLLAIFHLVEWWALLGGYCPLLKTLIGEPKDPIDMLQPASAAAGISSIVDDSDARKAPEDGGIGYQPLCATLEGMCVQIYEWNEQVRNGGIKGAKV